jgi:hypothetical protein
MDYETAEEQLRTFLEEFDKEDRECEDGEDDSDRDSWPAHVSVRKARQRVMRVQLFFS